MRAAKMKEKGKALYGAVYALGTLITAVLFIMYCLRPETVLFPDAMLPMKLYEQASVWLGLGAVPMTAACILFWKACGVSEYGKKTGKCLLIFIPAIICGCFFLYWAAVWIIAFLKMLR